MAYVLLRNMDELSFKGALELGVGTSIGMEFKPRLQEKRWDISKEVELIRKWEEEGLFDVNIDEKRPTIVIDTPPPYPSGRPHIGGIAHYAQIDMIARFFRMRGL